MKKILLTLLLALPFCVATKAQDFRMGVTGGYNLSSPSVTNRSPVSMSASRGSLDSRR